MHTSPIRASLVRLAVVMTLAALLHPLPGLRAEAMAIIPPTFAAESPEAEAGSLTLHLVSRLLAVRHDADDAIAPIRRRSLFAAGAWIVAAEERRFPLALPAPLRLTEPDHGYL